MKKKKIIGLILLLLFCLPLALVACGSNDKKPPADDPSIIDEEPPIDETLATPPKYIGYSFEEPVAPISPAVFSAFSTSRNLAIQPMSETTDEPVEISPDNDLSIVLIYENEKRDMIVDVIVDDSLKGNNQVYSATSQNNNISSIETIYSDERNTWITEVTLLVKSNNQPVNDRTIEIKETTFLRDLIKEGIAEIDDEAETIATYTILSRIGIDDEVMYGRVGEKITIEEPSTGGREFIGFYYYENSTKINYTPDNDGKYEFLNKPIELQIEWENLTYKIEYIVDGERYGEIAEFTFSGNNDILKAVSVKSNVAGTRETGEYFDGWYLSSSLLGERVENEESLSSLIEKSEPAQILKLYGQILHSRFDPERNFFTYKPAQEYGFEGYAIAFNFNAMNAQENRDYYPQTLTIPSVVHGKKIDVVEGLKSYWESGAHGIGTRMSQNLIIADGISYISVNALKAPWESISLPNNIEIDDPNFGNWFSTTVTVIYRD